MDIKGSVRRKSKELFEKVISLRKTGFSYGEIVKETGLAKSTINNWITHAGLNLSKEHLQIQAIKRVENHVIGTEASRVTRAKRKDEDIQKFIESVKKHFDDPFFVSAIMLYEAEGTKKGGSNGLSNSDFRLIIFFIKFLEKYLFLDRHNNLTFRLYIHETRSADLQRLINFWSKKLSINPKAIKVSWKHNIVTKRQENLNYVGQFEVRMHGVHNFTSKIVALSDIILARYLKS